MISKAGSEETVVYADIGEWYQGDSVVPEWFCVTEWFLTSL